jgi:hypothetical protein
MSFHLAQINIAQMKGVNLDDPIMHGFTSRLDEINAIAESHDGFIWRLKDENNNAISYNPFDNEQLIINMSVWRDVDSLFRYVYHSSHRELIKGKKEWFQNLGKPHMAMWWVEAGHTPTLSDAKGKLALIEQLGACPEAFHVKHLFDPNGNTITYER